MSSKLVCYLVAGAVLALLGGCGRDEVRADFMDGCVHSGVSKSVCKCVFEKVEPDLRAMHASGRMAPGEVLGQRIVQASMVCLRN